MVKARDSALQTVLDFHRDEVSKRIKRSGSWDTLILGILQQREFKIMRYLRRRLWKNDGEMPKHTFNYLLSLLESRIYSKKSHDTLAATRRAARLRIFKS